MPFLIIFALLLMPFLEIGVFVQVGNHIGAGNTILLSLLTGIIGIFMIRTQGLHNISKIRNQINHQEAPFEGVFEGIIILIAGFFLIIPGFVTDSIGLILFIPFARKIIYSILTAHQKTIIREEYSSKNIFEEQKRYKDQVIDADYKDISNNKKEES